MLLVQGGPPGFGVDHHNLQSVRRGPPWSTAMPRGARWEGWGRCRRQTVAWARYCATAASQTARTGQPRARAAASASANSAVAVPNPARPSVVSATLTVTTWLAPGGPTSTATDVREAVSRFIRDQRTASDAVWAKLAAAIARQTGSEIS